MQLNELDGSGLCGDAADDPHDVVLHCPIGCYLPVDVLWHHGPMHARVHGDDVWVPLSTRLHTRGRARGGLNMHQSCAIGGAQGRRQDG